MATRVQKVEGLERTAKLVQDNLADAIDSIWQRQVVPGVLLQGVTLAAATANQAVPHKLRRRPQGWSVVGSTANANVWSTQRDTSFLYLNTSADTTVDLWVF